jgi:membrane protease YdiL (CAAX protease family)
LEVVVAAVALLVLHARGFGIGSLYPQPTLRDSLLGAVLYLAATTAAMLSAAPFAGMTAAEQPIDAMVNEARLSAAAVVSVAIVNGTFEEVFLLGFLVRGLRGFGLGTALAVSVLVRVLYHLYQGPLGALSVLVFGLVLCVYFVGTDKLWPPVFAHIVADIVPFI